MSGEAEPAPEGHPGGLEPPPPIYDAMSIRERALELAIDATRRAAPSEPISRTELVAMARAFEAYMRGEQAHD